MSFTVKAGHVGQWRSVQEMLRQSYEDGAARVIEAIESRKQRGVPTDDRVDWRADVAALVAALPKDRDAVVDALDKAQAIARGGLRPWPPYELDPSIDGMEVRLRALTKGDLIDFRASISEAGGDGARAIAQRHRAARPLVAAVLVGVRGMPGVDGEVDGLTPDDARMPEVLDTLDSGGVLGDVFTVCNQFQDLSVPRRELYGSPRPSSSGTSTAASAPPSDGSGSAATVAHLVLPSPTTTSAGPTDAHAVTSSTTHGSPMPSLSTAPVTDGSGSTASG